MFKNRTKEGKKNLFGELIGKKRQMAGLSQQQLAQRLQLLGLDLHKNAIQKIECGQGFLTDIELIYFFKALNIDINEIKI